MTRIERYLAQFSNVVGKTFVVTGANSGLGYYATEHLVSLGATVIMACRNLVKAEEAKQELRKKYPNALLMIYPFDQADFTSIQAFVTMLKAHHSTIDGLILNAGIYHPKQGLQTKQGFPLTIGTNYLGVYYLLSLWWDHRLFDGIKKQRIIFVGSLSWYRVRIKKIDELLTTFAGDGTAQYCRSKTALGAFAFQLAKLKVKDGLVFPPQVEIGLMHPGITSTNIVGSMSSSFPAWFSWLAHQALYLFTHHPRIASLGIIRLALSDTINQETILVPRGLFHLSGYPKAMAYPKNLKENITSLLAKTEQVIAEVVEEK